jgi:hypothetical protein
MDKLFYSSCAISMAEIVVSPIDPTIYDPDNDTLTSELERV